MLSCKTDHKYTVHHHKLGESLHSFILLNGGRHGGDVRQSFVCEDVPFPKNILGITHIVEIQMNSENELKENVTNESGKT